MKKLTGWSQRTKAIKILIAFEKDKKLKEHIEKTVKGISFQDRAFIRELVSGTVRYLRLIDFSIEKATKIRINAQTPVVRNGLRIITYQLFFTKVPPYAAINETVEAVKRLLNKKAAGFVNAVAKRLTDFDYKKEVEKIDDFHERIAILYSFETWMVKRWETFYGRNELIPLLESLNKVAPLYIRVNRIKTTREHLVKILKEEGLEIEPHPFLEDLIRIKGRVPIEKLPGYKEGLFYIQDPASYLAAYLLNPQPGERILDVGAAPGGKTTTIASLTQNRAEIVAVDVNPKRMELLKKNAEKLGVTNLKTVLTDISKDSNFLKKYYKSFDKILIDAPCSATGVIRRHPEGKWNKSMELIKHNQKIQRELLKAAKDLLKEEGDLVYSVCSLEKEEGEENFLFASKIGLKPSTFQNLPDALKPKTKNGQLRMFPHKDNTDGFYYFKVKG